MRHLCGSRGTSPGLRDSLHRRGVMDYGFQQTMRKRYADPDSILSSITGRIKSLAYVGGMSTIRLVCPLSAADGPDRGTAGVVSMRQSL